MGKHFILKGSHPSCVIGVLKNTYCCCRARRLKLLTNEDLTSEAVQSSSLSLEGIDDIHGSDSLSLGMLSVGNGIADDVLQEHLQHTSGLFVDEATDSLDATSASKTTNSGLGDTLDVITKNLSVALSSSLPKSYS